MVRRLAQNTFHLNCASLGNSLIEEINGENEKVFSNCHCTNQNWFLKLHIFVCSDDVILKASLENWVPAGGVSGGEHLLSMRKTQGSVSAWGSGGIDCDSALGAARSCQLSASEH